MEDAIIIVGIILGVIQVIMIIKFFQIAGDLRFISRTLESKIGRSPYYDDYFYAASEEISLGKIDAAREILLRTKFKIENDPKLNATNRSKGIDKVNRLIAELN